LQRIKDKHWEFARRLFLCVAAASRPLRVEELADILAFDFKAGQIPKYHEDWRVENSVKAVISTCSTLLSIIKIENSQVIQFAHSSVKEFLTSARFAEQRRTISYRYHISMPSAHTVIAQACLGILLHLDGSTTNYSLDKSPLAKYAAEHWFEHARFEGVSQNMVEAVKQLFDKRKPHLAVWLWVYDPTVPFWRRKRPEKWPSPPHGTPLHYATFCGLYDIVKALVVEQSEDMNSRFFDGELTPLHCASQEGHIEVVQLLVEHGADVTARDKGGWTPLHWASSRGYIELTRFLVEHGADTTARDEYGETPLHRASEVGHMELARFLVEHGADTTARDKSGWTPLHRASEEVTSNLHDP
jgi:hypothetical protein